MSRKPNFSTCKSIIIIVKVQISFGFTLVFSLCQSIHLCGSVGKLIFQDKTVFSSFLKDIMFVFVVLLTHVSLYYFEGVYHEIG